MKQEDVKNTEIFDLSHLAKWRGNCARIAAFLLILWARVETEEFSPIIASFFVGFLLVATFAHGSILGRKEMFQSIFNSELKQPPYLVRSIVYDCLITLFGIYTVWNFF